MSYLESRQKLWEKTLNHQIEEIPDNDVWDDCDDVYLAMLGDRMDNMDDDLEDFAY